MSRGWMTSRIAEVNAFGMSGSAMNFPLDVN